MASSANSRVRVVLRLTPVLFFIMLCPAVSPQGQASTVPVPAAPQYSGEALVIEKIESTFKYNEDGTGEKTSSTRMRVQSEAGARQFSVLAIPFAAANEKPEFTRVVVYHSDGASTETPGKDAMEMPAPVTQQAPLYSDLKMLQVPVRGLRAGDVLEFSIRVERKNPEAAGQFWETYQFTKTFVVLSETVTLDVPASKYVQQWSAVVKPAITEKAGRKLYVWKTNQLKATPSGKKDEDEDADKSIHPDLAWTTFHSWAEVGEWYRSLAASRAVPNDAIRAQADEITRDSKTADDQARALYAFVSTHVRYIGIDFGVGRYQPHTATEVLTSQYGDCKDKDTLFEALLRAKNIPSAPALIGVNVDLVADLPSPAFFNHVITTVNLPSGRIWTDTTPGVAPFQMLVAPLRDKQALLIPAEGIPALERTPAEAPFPLKDRFEADATLTKDGDLSGHVNLTLRSDSEILVRAIAVNLAPAQWDQGTQLLANAMGFSGTTSNSQFDHPDDLTQPLHVSYDYAKKPFGDWANFRIVPLFPVNDLPAAPEKEPSKDIDLGAPRTVSVVNRIQLPEGFSADLPDSVHVKTPYAMFDKTYKLDNGELSVERDIVVIRSKVPPNSWQDYKKFTDDISLGNESWIQLTTKQSAGTGPHPPKPGENNPAAAALIQEVNDLEGRRDWDGALKKLDEAKKLNPEQPYLWSNYGYLAMVQNRPDEANTDYRRELSLHPDEAFVVKLYARFLAGRAKKDEARSVLQDYFERDPSDTGVAVMLSATQALDQPDDAIATLRKARDSNPKDPTLLNQLGFLLVRKHDYSGAIEIAGKLLDTAAENPGLLNDGAYLLAEADGDLTVAEKNSRRSLEILEGSTANAAVSEANQQSFGRTSLMVASWDTLGYILLKQKKVQESLDYLEAAWRNTPDVTVGLHYGMALEAAGKHEEALRVYDLSASTPRPASDPDWQALQERMPHHTPQLKTRGAPSTVMAGGTQTLQEERTFKVSMKTPCKTYVSSTLRFQLPASGEAEIMRVGGEGLSDGTMESLKELKLPHLVPTASKGRILRDAVVTCSAGKAEAYLVLMPLGSIDAEHTGQ